MVKAECTKMVVWRGRSVSKGRKRNKELLHLVIGILTAWRAAAGLEKDRL